MHLVVVTGPKDMPANPDPNFCMTKQKEYEDDRLAGNLGITQFLPECDSGGNYAPRQCIPGSM